MISAARYKQLINRNAELEAQKTPTPYSVHDVHLMSEQLVRAEETIARVEPLVERWIEQDTTLVAAHTRAMRNCANELKQALENDDE